MRLDFDFQGRGGYAIARRDAPVDLPDNFELAFRIRAEAPVNTLEIKLVGESGDNVWWTTKRDWDFPREWRRLSIKKRQFEFAWGPIGQSPLPKRISAIEIVVTAGTGGKGSVWIDDLGLSTLPPPPATPPPALGPWSADSSGPQTVELDLGVRHELGAMILDWGEAFASRYAVSASIDGEQWDTVARVEGSNGGRDYVYMPDTDARWLRLSLEAGPASGYELRRMEPKSADWSRSPNDFFAGIARDSRRGDWPRYLLGEQSYWTITGSNGGEQEALVSEDGSVELGDARVSLEPFVRMGDRTLSWAEVTTTQSLVDGSLPIPKVTWQADGVRLKITAFVTPDDLLRVRYELAAPANARLYLAIRPLQVNPSWQFLKRIGGVSRISRLAWDGKRLAIGSTPPLTLLPRTQPSRFGALAFHGGSVADAIHTGLLPNCESLDDATGWASGIFEFVAHDVTIDVPLASAVPAKEWTLDEVAAGWRSALGNVVIDVPDLRIAASIRANLGWILVNRDGPSIQPGARSYDRSWIRDGSLTSVALLRLGHEAEVREFIEWYAAHQYPNGAIPCCVSATGADPVPEHDSHGQFIFLVAEYVRYTKDRAFAARLWPRIEKTVAYIDSLRHQRMTDEYRAPDKRVFFGLVPESISHEGYSAKAMHSYWDDLFILRGLEDAVYLAHEAGRPEDATRIGVIRNAFRGDFKASIELAMKQHGIDYIPGCAELGDFDATSTTVFLAPGAVTGLDPKLLVRTFDKYWTNFLARRDGGLAWENYTPYELRVVGAFVRLGRRDRALDALDFFFRDQRPPGWRHWAEVVWREKRRGAFIGDMPHGWVASDFIRSALDLLAYERESDRTLVLAAGIPPSWLDGKHGVRVERLRTPYGQLSYTMAKQGAAALVRIERGITIPPGGIAIVSPFDGSETIVLSVPAEVVIRPTQAREN
ncbi:MAG: discoidin domain-containing protein [Thermoanaerobaculia bacterium]